MAHSLDGGTAYDFTAQAINAVKQLLLNNKHAQKIKGRQIVVSGSILKKLSAIEHGQHVPEFGEVVSLALTAEQVGYISDLVLNMRIPGVIHEGLYDLCVIFNIVDQMSMADVSTKPSSPTSTTPKGV